MVFRLDFIGSECNPALISESGMLMTHDGQHILVQKDYDDKYAYIFPEDAELLRGIRVTCQQNLIYGNLVYTTLLKEDINEFKLNNFRHPADRYSWGTTTEEKWNEEFSKMRERYVKYADSKLYVVCPDDFMYGAWNPQNVEVVYEDAGESVPFMDLYGWFVQWSTRKTILDNGKLLLYMEKPKDMEVFHPDETRKIKVVGDIIFGNNFSINDSGMYRCCQCFMALVGIDPYFEEESMDLRTQTVQVIIKKIHDLINRDLSANELDTIKVIVTILWGSKVSQHLWMKGYFGHTDRPLIYSIKNNGHGPLILSTPDEEYDGDISVYVEGSINDLLGAADKASE